MDKRKDISELAEPILLKMYFWVTYLKIFVINFLFDNSSHSFGKKVCSSDAQVGYGIVTYLCHTASYKNKKEVIL